MTFLQQVSCNQIILVFFYYFCSLFGHWVAFRSLRETTKSNTVDPIGNYNVSLTQCGVISIPCRSLKKHSWRILGHTFDPLSFIFIALLLSEFNEGLPHNGHRRPKKTREGQKDKNLFLLPMNSNPYFQIHSLLIGEGSCIQILDS